ELVGNVSQVTTRTTWVQNDAVYEYVQEPVSSGAAISNALPTVSKYPFDRAWLGSVSPDPQIITSLLKLPNSRIVGNTILDGRPAVEIAITTEKFDTQHVVTHSQTEQRLWVDTRANRIVRRQLITRAITGPQPGLVTTDTMKVTTYELWKGNTLPADLFKLKLPPGAQVIDKPNPYARP
ncbi:MAG: hypothetical protein ACJ78Q_05375, partial [Chloroflexia bacterium]